MTSWTSRNLTRTRLRAQHKRMQDRIKAVEGLTGAVYDPNTMAFYKLQVSKDSYTVCKMFIGELKDLVPHD